MTLPKPSLTTKQTLTLPSFVQLTLYFTSRVSAQSNFRPQDEVHPLVTSIFRFYAYWHKRRFLRQPKLMNAYLDASDLKIVQSNIPTKEVWSKKTKYTKETFSAFYG